MNTIMREYLDLLGERYGNLTVVKELPYRVNKRGKREHIWLCLCDCGNYIEETTHCLRQGYAHRCKSCARKDIVNHNLKRGESKDRLYRIWTNMKERCLNPNSSGFTNYGKRGIGICNEWQGENGYIKFKNWSLSHGYSDDLTIDRIDVNGDYEPTNCRWITNKEQQRNKRNTAKCKYKGNIISVVEAAEILGVSRYWLYDRVKKIGTKKDITTLDFSSAY